VTRVPFSLLLSNRCDKIMKMFGGEEDEVEWFFDRTTWCWASPCGTAEKAGFRNCMGFTDLFSTGL
jgi:hypothetical protein